MRCWATGLGLVLLAAAYAVAAECAPLKVHAANQGRIIYDLPEPTDVLVKVVSPSGTLVRLLSAGVADKGEHSVAWDGKDAAGRQVPRGEYACVVEAGLQADLNTGFGDRGILQGVFKNGCPWDLDVDSAGNLFVLDFGSRKAITRIYKFTAAGRPVADLDAGRNYLAIDRTCQAFAIGPADQIIATPIDSYETHVMDSQGRALKVLGGCWMAGMPGWSPGVAPGAASVAMGAGGKVYIEDRAYDSNHPEGHLAAFLYAAAPGESIGYPPALGIYLAPRSVSNKKDRVYFANYDNQIVCVRDIGHCLQVLSRIGKTGTGAGEFKTPLGPFCDSEGTVWVADRNNSRIQRIADTGTGLAFAWKFGSRGADAARGEFMAPHAVAVSPDGKLLYVAEDNQEYPSRAGGNDPVKGLARVTCYRLSYRYAGTQVVKIGP